MTPPDITVERALLKRSMLVTAVLGGVGIIWGLLVGSQLILFDGVFALLAIILSWLLLRASTLSRAEPSDRYPYGLEAATPLAIGIQGFVLLGTVLYAAVEAALAIRDGGVDVSARWALVYGVLTTLVCIVFTLWMRARSDGSDLVAAETTAWLIATIQGVGMIVGFAVILLLERSDWDAAAPYVDPVMVLVTCVVLVPAPIRMVRTTIVELLEGAPPSDVQASVREALVGVRAQFALGEPRVRMTKIGSKIYVEVDFVVPPETTVGHEDRVRRALRDRLDELPYNVWLNVELSADPSWSD